MKVMAWANSRVANLAGAHVSDEHADEPGRYQHQPDQVREAQEPISVHGMLAPAGRTALAYDLAGSMRRIRRSRLTNW
jgi:hypothetical protein